MELPNVACSSRVPLNVPVNRQACPSSAAFQHLSIGLAALAFAISLAPAQTQAFWQASAHASALPAAAAVEPDGSVVEVLSHDLIIELVPAEHRLVATDRMTLRVLDPAAKSVMVQLSHALEVSSLSMIVAGQERSLPVPRRVSVALDSPSTGGPRHEQEFLTVGLPSGLTPGQVVTLKWSYDGILDDPPRASRRLRFVAPSETSGHIGEEGVYLSGETRWYPSVPGSLAVFNVDVTVPEPWVAVTHGREVSREVRGGRVSAKWEVAAKTEALTVVANRFVKASRQWEGIELATYLFPEDAHMADEYLSATQRYLEVYTGLLGPYPFPKFAVVENFFPGGLGMPSFTLLGNRVIKRRYVQPYALGHEIVHCWIGNSVLNNVEHGNWVEGLTTYLANYYYVELTGTPEKAREERRRMLVGYAVYVRPDQDYPLRAFQSKTDQRDNAIGYQKAAMVFHMLRREIGEAAFWKGIRNLADRHRGRYASWKTLEQEFSLASSRELGWFFEQWVERPGAPQLTVTGLAVSRRPGLAGSVADGYVITGRIGHETTEQAFRLAVPVLVRLEKGGTIEHTVRVAGSEQPFSLPVATKPLRLEVDGGYETFRRLNRRALPPILNLYVTDRARSVILPARGPESDRRPYERLAQQIAARENGIRQTRTRDARTGSEAVLVLGGPALNPATDWATRSCPDGVALSEGSFTVGGNTYEGSEMAVLLSCRHPDDPEHVVSLFYGLSPGAASRVARLLFFYGWQSYLVFQEGRVLLRGDFEPDHNPLLVTFD